MKTESSSIAIRARYLRTTSFAPMLGTLVLAMLTLLPGAGGAWAQTQPSDSPVPSWTLPPNSSNTERLIDEGHRLLHKIRADHETVHDVRDNGNAVIAAQIVLHDESAPMLARLDGVSESDLTSLPTVWQMLYFETRCTLEFYLACSSQSPDDRAEKAKASVADGDKTIELLQRIAAKHDPADVWIFEDQKSDIVRWFQAAAEGITFQATHDQGAKEAAIRFWNGISQDFRQRHPLSPSSHLLGIIPGTVLPDADPPAWPRYVGVGFASVAALFLMVLVLVSVFGKEVSPGARPILVFFFALCCAMASAFIAGSLDLRGSLPFFGDKPLVVGATGGLAVLILLILIGNRAWNRFSPSR